eukprot:CAMPEP_0176498190 /NCGR_PEP_ID=MMETSP0200_2-20121128/12176_1 /TAXON_ID=947934 /ORGANISM="Chaetoceros sp., Strain GSL56" /LENGTH=157 /DNA_ID=CAMNT_0017896355 /DNA_START=62 /DNA_END=532 /DNA_ORIENTATION=-
MDAKSNGNNIVPKAQGKSNPPWRHKFATPKKSKPIKKSWLDETPAFLRYNSLSIMDSSKSNTLLSYEAMRCMVAALVHMEDNGRYLFEPDIKITASLIEKEDKIKQFVASIFENDGEKRRVFTSSSNSMFEESRRTTTTTTTIIDEDMDAIRIGTKI